MRRHKSYEDKCYTPHEDLVDLLKKQLHKKIAARSGVDLDEGIGKRSGSNRMKVYYLDKHIFQAMANLTFFFEATAKHPELEEIYKDDIEDLLGIRRSKSKRQECGFMFSKLLRSILKVGDLHLHKEENIPRDFRLILNYDTMRMVRNKVSALLAGGVERKNGIIMLGDYKKEKVREVILDDFKRALAWTGAFTTGLDLVDNEEPHRTFDFDTEKLLK